MKREKIEPTAIGNGVAIPHGTPDNVIKPKVFVVRLAHPINWGGKWLIQYLYWQLISTILKALRHSSMILQDFWDLVIRLPE